MSHARVVVYKFQPGKTDEALSRAKQGLAPQFQKAPGFHSYNVVKVSDDAAISISVFDTGEHTNAAVQQAADWVKANIAELVVSSDLHVGEYINMV